MVNWVTSLFGSTPLDGWALLGAAITLVLGWLLSVYARSALLRVLQRWSATNEQTSNLIARVVRYGILLFSIGVALTLLGAPLQPVLAAVIIVTAVGLVALRGLANNFGAGLVIQARRPIRIGDIIRVEKYRGRVTELNGRSVVLLSTDGETIRIPNSQILEEPLVNEREAGALRSSVDVVGRSGQSFAAVLTVARDVMAGEPLEEGRAAPEILMLMAGAHGCLLRIRFWHGAADSATRQSEVVSRLGAALLGAGLDASAFTRMPPCPVAVDGACAVTRADP